MSKRRGVATAAELRAMPAAYRQTTATAKPDGNRAQRRAWAKATRQPLGRRNPTNVATTVRRVTGKQDLDVAAFQSFAD